MSSLFPVMLRRSNEETGEPEFITVAVADTFELAEDEAKKKMSKRSDSDLRNGIYFYAAGFTLPHISA